MYSILVAIDVLIAASLIGLVLIQNGKGATAGAAFGGGGGGGASSTVFGARGSASFLTRATAILAALFFINSIALAYIASHRPVAESVLDTATELEGQLPPQIDTQEIDPAKVIDPSGQTSEEIMEQIKQQIIEQSEQLDGDIENNLPTDVPGASLDTLVDPLQDLDQQSESAQQTIEEAVEQGSDAIEALPSDVPQ